MEGQFGNRDKWREAGLRWVEAVFLPLKVTPCCIVFPIFQQKGPFVENITQSFVITYTLHPYL